MALIFRALLTPPYTCISSNSNVMMEDINTSNIIGMLTDHTYYSRNEMKQMQGICGHLHCCLLWAVSQQLLMPHLISNVWSAPAQMKFDDLYNLVNLCPINIQSVCLISKCYLYKCPTSCCWVLESLVHSLPGGELQFYGTYANTLITVSRTGWKGAWDSNNWHDPKADYFRVWG